MGKKLKIVIAEDGTELGKSCEKALKSYGMDGTDEGFGS